MRTSRVAPASGASCSAVDVERLADAREQCVRRQAVQVADDAVVVEDTHLVVRERDGEEELVARVGRAAPLRRDARCGGRAMMAVGDVQRLERVELGCDRRIGGRRGWPRPYARRRSAPSPRTAARHSLAMASSSRNASFARYASSTGPVCAFNVAMLRTRSFSLSGRVSSWRRMRCCSYARTEADERDAGLRAPVHDHPVDVERRLLVADEHALRRRAARGCARLARRLRRSTASCLPASRSRGARCAGSSAAGRRRARALRRC